MYSENSPWGGFQYSENEWHYCKYFGPKQNIFCFQLFKKDSKKMQPNTYNAKICSLETDF